MLFHGRLIQIGGHNVRVVETDGEPLNTSWIGSWQTSGNRIAIQRNMPPSRKIEVLLHEVVHSILTSLSGVKELTEEVVVGLVGEGLIAFLRNNPDLIMDIVQHLMEETKEYARHRTEQYNYVERTAKPARTKQRPNAKARSGRARRSR